MPYSCALGDINNDKKIDIALSDEDNNAKQAIILKIIVNISDFL